VTPRSEAVQWLGHSGVAGGFHQVEGSGAAGGCQVEETMEAMKTKTCGQHPSLFGFGLAVVIVVEDLGGVGGYLVDETMNAMEAKVRGG